MNEAQPKSSTLSRYWAISREFTQTYFWAQIAVLLAYFGSGVGNLYVLDFSQLPGGAWVHLGKGMLDAVLFVLFSHFVLRSFLKQNVVPKSMTLSNASGLAGLIFLCSAVSVFMSVKLGKIAMPDIAQPESITFTVDGQERQIEFGSPFVWGVATLNQFVYFTIWSLAYIFWHASKSKRELKRQMQEARIQQLTNQLNPHFLFNTLNSIRALIFEDKEKAADLVTQLSELFRTHLQAHLLPSSTLQEEWLIAKQYLNIERVRLEERLQISTDIAEEVLSQKLPTLTLLTLIENAIKHGIAPNSEPGKIHLTARKSNEKQWLLTIVNSVGSEKNADGTGTGIINTEQRLRLMYADQAKLVKNESSNMFSITLELPYV